MKSASSDLTSLLRVYIKCYKRTNTYYNKSVIYIQDAPMRVRVGAVIFKLLAWM